MMIHKITQDKNIPRVTAPKNNKNKTISTLKQSAHSFRSESELSLARTPGNNDNNDKTATL